MNITLLASVNNNKTREVGGEVLNRRYETFHLKVRTIFGQLIQRPDQPASRICCGRLLSVKRLCRRAFATAGIVLLSALAHAAVTDRLETFDTRLSNEKPMPIGEITRTLENWLVDRSYSFRERSEIAARYARYMVKLNQAPSDEIMSILSRLSDDPDFGPEIKMGLARMHGLQANYELSYQYFDEVLQNPSITPFLRATTLSYLMVTNSENQSFATNGELINSLHKLLEQHELTSLEPLYHYMVADYYHSIQQLDIALEHYSEALDGAQKTHDWLLLSDILYAIGIQRRNNGEYMAAIEYFEKTIANDSKTDTRYSEYLALYGMATTYFYSGELDKAFKLAKRVTSHPLSTPFFASEIHKLTAKAYLKQGKPDLADAALKKSRAMFDMERSEEQTTWRAELEQIAASIAASRGDYKTAYKQFEKFHQAYLDAKKYDDLELIESARLVNEVEQEKAKAATLTRENQAMSALLDAEEDARRSETLYNRWLTVIIILILITLAIILVLFRKSRQTTRLNAAARDEAQLHNRLKSEFISNISHEIRTPLNAIIGFGQVLSGELDNTKHKTAIYQITNSSEMLLQLINDLLDFSKIEAGKLALDPAPNNIKRSIKKLGDIFSAQAKNKGLILVFKIDPTLPMALIFDELRFKQILANLISNGIKFSRQGNVEIGVVVIHQDSSACTIEVWVSDNGIGISKTQQALLFQPFTQAESSTARKFGGTGLGLHISNQLLHLMEARLQLESEKDKGAKFSFRLTLPISSQTQQVAPPDEAPKTFKKNRVLLAEDNDINAEVFTAMLAETNLHITRVENGIQALEKLNEEQFDIVFMDVQMPEMDGYEATRRIRNEMELTIPVIALTANAMQQDIDQCIQSGMDEHIAKPIQLSQLLMYLNQYLNQTE